MVKKIRFTISPEGEIELNVEGAVGDACEALSKPFEDSLGIVAKKTLKDSYYVTQGEQINESAEHQI